MGSTGELLPSSANVSFLSQRDKGNSTVFQSISISANCHMQGPMLGVKRGKQDVLSQFKDCLIGLTYLTHKADKVANKTQYNG